MNRLAPEISQKIEQTILLDRKGYPIQDLEGNMITINNYCNSIEIITAEIDRRLQQVKDEPSKLETKDTFHSDKQAILDHKTDFDSMSIAERLNYVERASVKHIIALAKSIQNQSITNEIDQQLDLFAINAFQRAFSLSSLITTVDASFDIKAEHLEFNRSIIKESWEKSEGNIEEAVLEAVKRKKQKYGSCRVIIWNDVDQNLTFDETHNDIAPCTRYTLQAYSKLGRNKIESTVYTAIYGFLCEEKGIAGAWGREVFRQVGKDIKNTNILELVEESFALAFEKGIEMHILSRNIQMCAEGLRNTLLIRHPDRIIGRSEIRCITLDKPRVVLGELMKDPTTLHIIVDDADEALTKAISEEYFKDKSRITDHAFLICRAHKADKQFGLKKTLEEKGIPHGTNNGNYGTLLKVLEALQS